MQNYSYLRPPTIAIKNSPSTLRSHSGQYSLMIMNENRLQPEQKQALIRLKQYLKTKYPNRQISDHLLLRYCYLGQFRTAQSVKKFNYYDEWWSIPQIDKNKLRGILHSGVFYCYGRDHEYAPNLYVHPQKINLHQFLLQDYLVCLRTFLIPVQEHMLIEGKIQQWNVLIDVRSFNDSKLKQFFSIILGNLLKICHAYPCRSKRIFIINPDSYTNLLAKVGMSSTCTQTLLNILKQLDFEKIILIEKLTMLDKYINSEERQKKYGGILPDLLQFWPISSTNRLMEVNSRFIQGSQIQQTEYQSVINDRNAQFFGEKNQNIPKCRCCIQ